MAQQSIPVYVLAGFLESGKTTMIRELLEDPEFTEGEKTLLIVCEEGEEEFPETLLKRSNTVMTTVDKLEDMTYGYLAKLNKKEKPQRVILEYNGTWSLEALMQHELPASWEFAQIITPVNAETFDLYIKNMRQMMVEHLTYADLIVFNRCTDETPVKVYWRNMKMINRAAMLIFEKAGGDVIEVSGEDILPYDLKAPVIEIKDDDFGIWYVDAMENPDRYEGKTVQFTGMAYREPNFPAGYFVPGRFAMTCCANDMQFMGYLCKSKVAEKLKKDTWVEVTAVVHHEYMEAYGGQAPVLYAKRVAPGVKPENEYVYLY